MQRESGDFIKISCSICLYTGLWKHGLLHMGGNFHTMFVIKLQERCEKQIPNCPASCVANCYTVFCLCKLLHICMDVWNYATFVRRPQGPLASSGILLGSSLGQLLTSNFARRKSLVTPNDRLSSCDSNDTVTVYRLLHHCPLKVLPLG